MKNRSGFIDVSLVAIGALIIGLSSLLTLMADSTITPQKKATAKILTVSTSPSCPADTKSERTYGECCGCGKAKEVRECTMNDGSKQYHSSDCVHDSAGCTNNCPAQQPSTPTQSTQPAPTANTIVKTGPAGGCGKQVFFYYNDGTYAGNTCSDVNGNYRFEFKTSDGFNWIAHGGDIKNPGPGDIKDNVNCQSQSKCPGTSGNCAAQGKCEGASGCIDSSNTCYAGPGPNYCGFKCQSGAWVTDSTCSQSQGKPACGGTAVTNSGSSSTSNIPGTGGTNPTTNTTTTGCYSAPREACTAIDPTYQWSNGQCCPKTTSPTDQTGLKCGNGVVDPGEACDTEKSGSHNGVAYNYEDPQHTKGYTAYYICNGPVLKEMYRCTSDCKDYTYLKEDPSSPSLLSSACDSSLNECGEKKIGDSCGEGKTCNSTGQCVSTNINTTTNGCYSTPREACIAMDPTNQWSNGSCCPKTTSPKSSTSGTVPLGGSCQTTDQCVKNNLYRIECREKMCKKYLEDIEDCIDSSSKDTSTEAHVCKTGLSYDKPSGSNLCCPNSEPNCDTYCAKKLGPVQCTESQTMCKDLNNLYTCKSGKWIETRCDAGCANNACESAPVTNNLCDNKVAGDYVWSNDKCYLCSKETDRINLLFFSITIREVWHNKEVSNTYCNVTKEPAKPAPENPAPAKITCPSNHCIDILRCSNVLKGEVRSDAECSSSSQICCTEADDGTKFVKETTKTSETNQPAPILADLCKNESTGSYHSFNNSCYLCTTDGPSKWSSSKCQDVSQCTSKSGYQTTGDSNNLKCFKCFGEKRGELSGFELKSTDAEYKNCSVTATNPKIVKIVSDSCAKNDMGYHKINNPVDGVKEICVFCSRYEATQVDLSNCETSTTTQKDSSTPVSSSLPSSGTNTVSIGDSTPRTGALCKQKGGTCTEEKIPTDQTVQNFGYLDCPTKVVDKGILGAGTVKYECTKPLPKNDSECQAKGGTCTNNCTAANIVDYNIICPKNINNKCCKPQPITTSLPSSTEPQVQPVPVAPFGGQITTDETPTPPPHSLNIFKISQVLAAEKKVVPFAQVIITDSNGKTYQTTADQFGKFKIDLPVGITYTVKIVASGYKTVENTVNITDSTKKYTADINLVTTKNTKTNGTIKVQETIKPKIITLTSGWNLISLPVNPTKSYTALSLLVEINKQGGKASMIARLQNGSWQVYILDKVGEDFPIEVGKAYFIFNQNDVEVTVTGQDVTNISYQLSTGWNSVGFPKKIIANQTADMTLKLINQEQCTVISGNQCANKISVSQYLDSLWQSRIKNNDQDYGDNFNIEDGNGYLLKVESPISLTP